MLGYDVNFYHFEVLILLLVGAEGNDYVTVFAKMPVPLMRSMRSRRSPMRRPCMPMGVSVDVSAQRARPDTGHVYHKSLSCNQGSKEHNLSDQGKFHRRLTHPIEVGFFVFTKVG